MKKLLKVAGIVMLVWVALGFLEPGYAMNWLELAVGFLGFAFAIL
jgi:hypothetical protein